MRKRYKKNRESRRTLTVVSKKEIEDLRNQFHNKDTEDLILAFNDTCVEEINPDSIAGKLFMQTDNEFLKKLRKKLKDNKIGDMK
ncbi:MAG: hypothetical protein DRQ43_09260 [Gammaproteobacteria bacterium]|nr:MAG: hypothetical protein DRQ43_09260 [Gammaproteobacteria bacterium]